MLSQRAQDMVPSSVYNEMWDLMKQPWDGEKNPQGFVNLGVAENQLMQDELKAYMDARMDIHGSVLTYQEGPLGSKRLRQALARFLGRHLNAHRAIKPSQIIVTNGVTTSLEHAAWALADAGEAFLLGRPYYGALTLEQRAGVRTVPVAFGQVDPLGPGAVECYEEALLSARDQGIVVKGLFLCSPHNPLGRCYPRHVILQLLALCQKYRIHLLSDEVYALSVWHAPSFTSILSLDLDGIIDPSLVHVLWGVSKDFGANGWRLGCLISQANEELRAALSSVAIYSYASSITDHLVAQMLLDDSFTTAYLAESRRRLAAAYTRTTRFLQRHRIPFTGGTHAALFVWADLGTAYRRRHPDIVDSDEAIEQLKKALFRQRVYLAWGGNFDSESPDMFRIVFAHPTHYLDEGLERINQALDNGISYMPLASSSLPENRPLLGAGRSQL
ncbi:1-aminocyclopropane-1-carboxylate synthase [Curvularia clavata]|uniref:1-aminocyclopropane-1-carboxylate synthase n=1 Tax=Curvularia clavata TaxID=95742 RepID=A0A9Q8ZAN6_CURCL|nr:1-aminocyclopropane-1-carboxylate synthase [Curvularia clavata]